ncbi:MAG: DMT family transporter, partial [Actinomycetota bacterium]
AGVAILTQGSLDADPTGVALAVVAGASFPTFGLAAQRLMTDDAVLPAMAIVFGAGAFALLPIAVITAGEVVDSVGAVLTVSTLGVVTLALAYWLWGLGLRQLSLGVVVTVTLVEPAVASVLAVTVLDEPATVWLAVGLILVGIGVWASARHPDQTAELTEAC